MSNETLEFLELAERRRADDLALQSSVERRVISELRRKLDQEHSLTDDLVLPMQEDQEEGFADGYRAALRELEDWADGYLRGCEAKSDV